MASDLNSVNLIGRLVRDPELRSTKGGTSVCEFSVAVNASQKQGEEWADVGHFFNVVSFKGTAESVAKFCHKGDRVAISGRLQQNTWETDEGAKRERVNVLANNVHFLTPKKQETEEAPF